MESKENPSKEYKPGDHYRGIRPPHKVPGCSWQLIKRHVEKGYPEEWILTSKEPYEPSSVDEVPLSDEPLFRTKEEAEEYSRKKLLEKMERDWNNATSADGRPPIGGAQDD